MHIDVNQGRINGEQYNGNRKMARGQISVIAPLQGVTQGKALYGTLVDEKELGGAVGAGQFRCGNVSLKGNSSLRGIERQQVGVPRAVVGLKNALLRWDAGG